MPAKKKSSTPSGIVARTIKRYGWVPDIPDQRDLIFAAPRALLRKLPSKVDLRPYCPPVYDQGSLGSRTANAIGAALEFNQLKQGWAEPFTPSRLFIYYNERVIEHTVDEDAGAMNRDGIKSVAKLGAPPEDPDRPYDIARFRRAKMVNGVRPPILRFSACDFYARSRCALIAHANMITTPVMAFY